MLPFFRKIRYRLAKNNQFFKYSKYAIGEIVLVVIGILIALQINNWNEGLHEKKIEKKIILEIKENLKNDINLSQTEIEIQLNHINDIKNLIRHLRLNLPNHDTLNFISVTYFEHLYVNKSAYETLKNIGFEKLRSKILKRELTKYYDISTNRRLEITSKMNDIQVRAINQYHWNLRNTYQGEEKDFDYYMATNGVFFINYLHERINWKQNFINDILIQHIDQSEYIINTIDEVLKTQE